MARTDRDSPALRSSRGQRGCDRQEYFSRPGATACGWRGGPHMVEGDHRKEEGRRACRGPCNEE